MQRTGSSSFLSTKKFCCADLDKIPETTPQSSRKNGSETRSISRTVWTTAKTPVAPHKIESPNWRLAHSFFIKTQGHLFLSCGLYFTSKFCDHIMNVFLHRRQVVVHNPVVRPSVTRCTTSSSRQRHNPTIPKRLRWAAHS